MGIALIVVGVCLTVAGVVFVAKAKAASVENCIASEAVAPPKAEPKTSKEKGNDFEAFIADVLNANSIKLKQWNQGTVSGSGVIADNALNPDFFVEQPDGQKTLEYWVECKWRAKLDNDAFSIDGKQYDRYRKIQRESKRKIIVAVGLGGSPDKPKETFFIPLDSIKDGKILLDDMRHFFLSQPQKHFAGRMNKWFHNEVFK